MEELTGKEGLTLDEIKMYSVKTITGEKILCTFTFNPENKTFALYYPIVMKRYYDVEESGMRTIFEKYAEESDEVVSIIYENHVVSIATLSQEFRDYYIRSVQKFYAKKELKEEVNRTFEVEGTQTVN